MMFNRLRLQRLKSLERSIVEQLFCQNNIEVLRQRGLQNGLRRTDRHCLERRLTQIRRRIDELSKE